MKQQETVVVIVGAGPAGLATSACLNHLSIPNIVLEREDCAASLWKKRAYDRLKLHLAKEFCELPHMPYPSDTPTFVPRKDFIRYLDTYMFEFDVNPLYERHVEAAWFDEVLGKWRVKAKDTHADCDEEYVGEFLVVAAGENSLGFVPNVNGLERFGGEVMHANEYENGMRFRDKSVLVVGAGNSGMEIAYDLNTAGAATSIVVRSPVHVLNKEMVRAGMHLLRFLPFRWVDNMILAAVKFLYGKFSDYGLRMPIKGPFYLKKSTGRSPIVDVGTLNKIRTGEIKVLPSITKIEEGNHVSFANEDKETFDAIIFATGYKSTVKNWLKDASLFNEDGMPIRRAPEHWKGENGVYCAGFSSSGLAGISKDATNIANDIYNIIKMDQMKH